MTSRIQVELGSGASGHASRQTSRERKTGGVHLWLILWKAFRSMQAHADRSIAALGLCQSDFGVLEALLHKGPLPVKSLGQKVQLTSGAMTAAIDRLAARGWVTRQDDPGDRRVRTIYLTPDGRKVIRALFAGHERDMDAAVSGLSARERTEAIDLLRKLGRTAQARLDTKGAETRREEQP
jgi:MarR family 2-MHQ and catechol resistance regulon transcriptional repressor